MFLYGETGVPGSPVSVSKGRAVLLGRKVPTQNGKGCVLTNGNLQAQIKVTIVTTDQPNTFCKKKVMVR